MVDYATNGQPTMSKEQVESAIREAFGIIVTKEVNIALVKYAHGANHYNALSYDKDITEDEYLKVREAINLWKER